MPEFDSTKRAIGVNKLDESDRKQMFGKFVEAGGQVLKETPEPKEDDAKKNRPQPKVRQGTISRNEFDDQGRSGGNSGGKNNSSKDNKSNQKGPVDPRIEYEKEISSFGARLAIKSKCWFGRVTPFSSSDVNAYFMHNFASNAKQALMECHYAGTELLGNPAISPELSSALDKINPLLVELIALTKALYNGAEVNEICEPIMQAPESAVPIERIKNPIYSLFKKLYILYPYQETLRKTMAQAYDELQKIEGKPALIYSSKKKKINQEVDNLFDNFFEKLYLIVIRSENKNIPLISRYMENLLGINATDKPGQRKIGQNVPGGYQAPVKVEEKEGEENSEESEGEEEEKKKEAPPLSKEQTYGLRLMQMYSIEKLRKKYDPKNDLKFVPDTDKALLSYLYFREFDDEYTFVMTTKKIEIKPVIVNGAKVDYRQKMQDIYESNRGIADQFKVYLDVMREMEKHDANPGSNYIEAAKKKGTIEQKRTGQSRTVRLVIKEFAQKSRDILLELIKDMKGKKEIVGNMDEIISLDAMEVKKRLNKKPIKQCIMESYCYALALFDRIESGDLYGGLTELTAEQMKESFGIDIEPKEENSDNSSLLQTEEPVEGNETKSEKPVDSGNESEETEETSEDDNLETDLES